MTRMAVLGAGSWGTALAVTLARSGNEVALWGRDEEHLGELARDRENRRYLPGVHLPPELQLRAALDEAVATAELLVLAVPAQALRGVARALGRVAGPVVIAAKGLEIGTGARPTEIVAEELGRAEIGMLSGPSFAQELALGKPTAVTVAFADPATARDVAVRLANATFRPYPSTDVVGVEVAGAFKNVVAIAAGIAMGRDLGENARAAVVTRGLAELTRLAMALGARASTLMGLSGLGDLVLTATSLTSRNTAFGYALGQGRSATALLGPGAKLAEGAFTAAAAAGLGARLGIDLPIARGVQQVIAGDLAIGEVIEQLLARPLPERE